MKILFLSTLEGSPWGGSELLWRDAARELLSRGHEVHVAAPCWAGVYHDSIIDLKRLGAAIIPRPFKSYSQNIRKALSKLPLTWPASASILAFLSWVASSKWDHVVISSGAQDFWPEFLSTLASRGIVYSLIVQAASVDSWLSDHDFEAQQAIYSNASNVFFVSQGIQEVVADHLALPRSFGRVAYNSGTVPQDGYTPLVENRDLDFAFVGRLHPQSKGVDVAINVCSMLKWQQRGLSLSIYGDGPSRRSLVEHSRKLNALNVEFLGSKYSISEIMSKHNVLLMPSRYEGMPLALIESMTIGRICICSSIPGIAELITSGSDGFLFGPPTEDNLDRGIEVALASRPYWSAIATNANRKVCSLIHSTPGYATIASAIEIGVVQ